MVLYFNIFLMVNEFTIKASINKSILSFIRIWTFFGFWFFKGYWSKILLGRRNTEWWRRSRFSLGRWPTSVSFVVNFRILLVKFICRAIAKFTGTRNHLLTVRKLLNDCIDLLFQPRRRELRRIYGFRQQGPVEHSPLHGRDRVCLRKGSWR
jgi:hypothetical protein